MHKTNDQRVPPPNGKMVWKKCRTLPSSRRTIWLYTTKFYCLITPHKKGGPGRTFLQCGRIFKMREPGPATLKSIFRYKYCWKMPGNEHCRAVQESQVAKRHQHHLHIGLKGRYWTRPRFLRLFLKQSELYSDICLINLVLKLRRLSAVQNSLHYFN